MSSAFEGSMTFNVPTSFNVAGFLQFAILTCMLSKAAAPFPEFEICLIESLYLLNIVLKSACTVEAEEKCNFRIKANIYKLQTGSHLLKLRIIFMDIHSLPFSIGFNGEAEVDSAFPVKIDNQSNSAESAFRGRQLVGRIHELPSNLSGKGIICISPP